MKTITVSLTEAQWRALLSAASVGFDSWATYADEDQLDAHDMVKWDRAAEADKAIRAALPKQTKTIKVKS